MSDTAWVLVSFLIFLAILVYFDVPKMLVGMLDARANRIKAQLDEARKAREDAQTLLADFERKQKDAQDEAEEILARARQEAKRETEAAQVALEKSIERRLKAAEERIAQAEAAAAREVREAAVATSVAAATQLINERMGDDQANAMIDDGIDQLATRLH